MSPCHAGWNLHPVCEVAQTPWEPGVQVKCFSRRKMGSLLGGVCAKAALLKRRFLWGLLKSAPISPKETGNAAAQQSCLSCFCWKQTFLNTFAEQVLLYSLLWTMEDVPGPHFSGTCSARDGHGQILLQSTCHVPQQMLWHHTLGKANWDTIGLAYFYVHYSSIHLELKDAPDYKV